MDRKKRCRFLYEDQANHLSPFLLNIALTLYYTGSPQQAPGNEVGCLETVFGIQQGGLGFRIQRYSTRYRGDRLVPEQCSGIFKRTTAKYKMEVSPHKIRHLVATILANLSPRRSRTSTTSPLR